MKLNILSGSRRAIGAAATIAALLVLGGFTAKAQPSPVGTTWDCLLSGSGEQGIAFITFSSNASSNWFTGYQIASQNQRINGSSGGGRNSGGDVGRSISTDTNAPPSGGTNLIGFSPVTGPWWFDEKGRVVGYFVVVGGSHDCVTNLVPVSTNVFVSTNTMAVTNVFQNEVCVTLPVFTNMVPLSYDNQTTWYVGSIPILTVPPFEGPSPVTETNLFLGSNYMFSITLPVFTNSIASNFINQTTWYTNAVPFFTSQAVSLSPTTATNPVPAGVFSVTLPILTNTVSYFSNQTICYTNEVDCSTAVTNAISFVGKPVPGKRLTLVSSTPGGKVTYKGVPYKKVLPGIDGSWYGTKKENNQQFLESFNLTSFAIANPFAGIADITNFSDIYFSTNGAGPALTFNAFCMLSSQKKIAFTFETFPAGATSVTSTNEGKLGVTFGSFNRSKKATKANTKGFEEPSPGTSLSVPMTFQSVLQLGP